MIKEQTTIIYEVRGKKVVLDRDLARLLQMETKVLNQRVKRNIELFQDDCYFQLTTEEFMNWKSQIVTSNGDKMGLRKAPYVFTEEGVKKLSQIFHSDLLVSFDYNESVLNMHSNIAEMIYEIRGKQVMLDFDVAFLFGYEVKQLNRQVQRNINRFPENYCFQLSREEYQLLRCQNGTLEVKRGQYSKYLPYVFTEYGITMLAGILKSEIAISMKVKN